MGGNKSTRLINDKQLTALIAFASIFQIEWPSLSHSFRPYGYMAESLAELLTVRTIYLPNQSIWVNCACGFN